MTTSINTLAILTAISVMGGYANVLYHVSRGRKTTFTQGLIQIFLSMFVGVTVGIISKKYLSMEVTYAAVSVSSFISIKILELLDNQTSEGIGNLIRDIVVARFGGKK